MMKISIPRRSRWLTLLTAIWGLAFFFWLGEEGSVPYVVALGVGGAALLVLHTLRRWLGGQRLIWPKGLALGLLAGQVTGLLAGLSTVTLMAVKTSLHGHGISDYPPAVVAGTLARIPVWAVAGGLIGLGWVSLAVAETLVFSEQQEGQKAEESRVTIPAVPTPPLVQSANQQ